MSLKSSPILSIPVFLASDENYAPFLCTTMYSILQNTKHTVEFYVLDGGILDTTKQQIAENLQTFSNFSIDYTDMSSFALERFPNVAHFSVNTFSRYFIPQIQPQINKAIYLDVDIIVQCDIADLYSQDLQHYALGAVPQLRDMAGRYLKEQIYPNFTDPKKYFNAGILLIDLEKFRTKNISQQLVDLTLEMADILKYPDQDALNIFFDNKFKRLENSYNYMTNLYEYLAEHRLNEKDGIRNTAKIIHFAGPKPWKKLSVDFSYKFWDTLQKTSFYEQVLFSLLDSREKRLETSLQKRLETWSQKQNFSHFRYYRYKILREITWGTWREKYKTKFQKLKKIKKS